MKTFPIPADMHYDYADRFGEGPGEHKGTDIFAAEGVPVVACIDGAVHPDTDPKGGLVMYLSNETGSEVYYYAHLLDQADMGSADYTIVKAGDVIGHVGVSGNAAGTPPHLHIQARWNGVLTNPYPMLREVDKHSSPGGGTYRRHPPGPSMPGGGTFPRTGKPSSGEPPSDSMSLEMHAWAWGIALVLGVYLAYKTLAPNRRAHG